MYESRMLLFLFLFYLPGFGPVLAQDDSSLSTTSLEVLEIFPGQYGTGWNVLFHNSSDAAITALALQIETYFDDGTDAKAVHTVDFISADDYLQPGTQSEKVVQSVEKEEANTIEIMIRPVMVLFDDLSFEGDATLAEQILLSREAAQLARVHWLRSLRRLTAQKLDEEQLAEQLRQVIHRLENHTDRLSNQRVSTNHHSARLKESSLAKKLHQLMESSTDRLMSLRERLQALITSLENELVQFSNRVTHDLEARPLRTPRRR